MKGFQGRPSLQSTTASRGSPKQGPRSSPPPTMSSSPRSAHPTPSSLNSPFLQGPSFNDSSLNSPFLQGPSLNEIEKCLTGLSAEEMEQVGDHHFGHKPNKVSDNSVEKKTNITLIFAQIKHQLPPKQSSLQVLGVVQRDLQERTYQQVRSKL